MNKAYFMSAARYTLAGAVIFSVFAAVLFGAFVVLAAVAVPFLILFPLVLMTKPAIERAAKASLDKLTAWLESKNGDILKSKAKQNASDGKASA